MKYEINVHESGFVTVLTYASVGIKKNRTEKNSACADMLLERCGQYQKQAIMSDVIEIGSVDDEDIVLALAGMAEAYIEDELLKMYSTEILNSPTHTKTSRKNLAVVQSFIEVINKKGKTSLNQYFVSNGIDDDILMDMITDALNTNTKASDTDLIDDQLKSDLRVLVLGFVRERLGIKCDGSETK